MKRFKFIYVIVALSSLMFLMIATDKFFPFLEPPCSLADILPPMIWKILGVLQLSAAVLLWIPRFRKPVAGFFIAFMAFFSIVHLAKGTYDIGGAVFMAVLMAIILWNPPFLGGRSNSDLTSHGV